MELVARTLAAQRQILALMVLLVALVFWRGAYTVFSMPKAVVVLLAVVGLLVCSAVRLLRTRQAFLPAGGPLWAVGAFVAALALATVTSPNPLGSVAGQGGRYTGLVMYIAYALVFAYAIRLYRHHSPVQLVQVLAAAALPIVGYGFAQLAGADPLVWGFSEHGPPMFSTLGNPNFFAAWAGIVAVLALTGACLRSLPTPWRVVCAVAGVGCAMATVASQSLQGPAAFAVGGALLGGAVLWGASGRPGRRRAPGLAAAGVALAVGAGLLVAGAGPLGGLRNAAGASYRSRVDKWEAAWAMFLDRPLLGQGLDRFAERYWTFRSVEEAAARGIERNVDAVHSVPLDMLASGGVLLGLAYLAVLVAVAWSLAVGLRRLDGDRRLLLAGFGGAWLAYQVQSAVSIDMPALAALGWLLGGVVVALAGTATLREVDVRGPRRPIAVGWAGLLGLTTAGAVVAVLWPLSADLAAGSARTASAEQRRDAAVAGWAQAARLAPWDPRYAAELGHELVRAEQPVAALDAYATAWSREASLFRALTPARVAARYGAHDEAALWFARALAVDGAKTPPVLREAGELRLAAGDAAGARAVYERAAELYPDDPEWTAGLERARRLHGS